MKVSSLFPLFVGPRDWSQVDGIDNRSLYLLSHPTSPYLFLYLFICETGVMYPRLAFTACFTAKDDFEFRIFTSQVLRDYPPYAAAVGREPRALCIRGKRSNT